MYGGKTVGAVVPAHDEADAVGDVIETLPGFVDRAYVVDDGSTDGTLRVVREYADAANERVTDPPTTATGVTLDPRVVAVVHEENRGVGGAVKSGYRRVLSDGIDVTVVVAGDARTDPDVVERIVAPVADGDADYAKATRDCGVDSPTRRVRDAVHAWATRAASGYWTVSDLRNGATAISWKALAAVDLDDLCEDGRYCTDLLVRLNARGATVADVPFRADGSDDDASDGSSAPKVSPHIAREFVWRLEAKYLDKGSYSVPLLYVLGAVGACAGIAASAVVLFASSSGATDAFGILVTSVAFIALAVLVDYAANRDLAVTVDE